MIATYNYWLVFVSLLVAILASYTALDLATRIKASRGSAARTWLVGGAFSMGVGIWSMHFVGMLAFHLPIPMGYDVPITLLSMLIAILVSGFALYIVSRDTLSARNLIVGGVLMGLGICAMHYTGMAAMETYPPITYDPLLFAASVAIAIAAAFAALWIAFTLRGAAGWTSYSMRLGRRHHHGPRDYRHALYGDGGGEVPSRYHLPHRTARRQFLDGRHARGHHVHDPLHYVGSFGHRRADGAAHGGMGGLAAARERGAAAPRAA